MGVVENELIHVLLICFDSGQASTSRVVAGPAMEGPPSTHTVASSCELCLQTSEILSFVNNCIYVILNHLHQFCSTTC